MMKKFKKLFSIVLATLLMFGVLCSIAGCNILNKRTKFYNDKTLLSAGLGDLPKPDFKYKGHDNWDRSIEGDITEEAFNDYAQELFAYMDENFEYLGTVGETLSDYASYNPSGRFVNCERKLENYRKEIKNQDGELNGYEYFFVYFTEAPSDENSWSTYNHVRIYFSLNGREKKGKKNDKTYVKYTYNFIISIRRAIGLTAKYIDVNSLIEDYYEECYPDCVEATVEYYYGKTEDGLYAVMMTASNESYDDEVWTETVAGRTFHYPNGNRIVLTNAYNSEFKTLSEAHEMYGLMNMDLDDIEAKHREFYPYLYEEHLPEECPEDFAFSLTWNTYGISSYDSKTGKLVKTDDAPIPEDYITTYFLTDEERLQIYQIIYDLKMEDYPDIYNPVPDWMSEPSDTLILSVQTKDFNKTITAEDVAWNYPSNEKGQKFIDSIGAISDILEATEEWKALPDYPYLYE